MPAAPSAHVDRRLRMTRSARTRRGNRKAPLTATPWNYLKAGDYAPLVEGADSSSSSPSSAKLKKVEKGDLKETRKKKLAETLSKKIPRKLVTAKKLKAKLTDSATLSLLSLSDVGGRNLNIKKKKKKTLESKEQPFGGDLVQHFGEDPCGRSSTVDTQSGAVSHASSTSIDRSDNGRSASRAHRNRSKDSLIPESQRLDDKRKKQIEARRLRRQRHKCRKQGHLVQDCPDPDSGSCVAGICFKCGSAEHISRACGVSTAEGNYPYAKCFICGELGHLSKSCPDNPKGLYPKGGCCKLCGSVEHLKSNCPQKMKKIQKSSGFSGDSLVIANPYTSADAEDIGADIGIERGSRKQIIHVGKHSASTKHPRTVNRSSNGAKHKVIQF